jgi:hypothetical protein
MHNVNAMDMQSHTLAASSRLQRYIGGGMRNSRSDGVCHTDSTHDEYRSPSGVNSNPGIMQVRKARRCPIPSWSNAGDRAIVVQIDVR